MPNFNGIIPPRPNSDDKDEWNRYWQEAIESGSTQIVTPNGAYKSNIADKSPYSTTTLGLVIAIVSAFLLGFVVCSHVR